MHVRRVLLGENRALSFGASAAAAERRQQVERRAKSGTFFWFSKKQRKTSPFYSIFLAEKILLGAHEAQHKQWPPATSRCFLIFAPTQSGPLFFLVLFGQLLRANWTRRASRSSCVGGQLLARKNWREISPLISGNRFQMRNWQTFGKLRSAGAMQMCARASCVHLLRRHANFSSDQPLRAYFSSGGPSKTRSKHWKATTTTTSVPNERLVPSLALPSRARPRRARRRVAPANN